MVGKPRPRESPKHTEQEGKVHSSILLSPKEEIFRFQKTKSFMVLVFKIILSAFEKEKQEHITCMSQRLALKMNGFSEWRVFCWVNVHRVFAAPTEARRGFLELVFQTAVSSHVGAGS